MRKHLIEIIVSAGSVHTGGSLSSVDILVALYCGVLNIDSYNLHNPDRDRFILSKGHSVEWYYSVLEICGFISEEILNTYGKY